MIVNNALPFDMLFTIQGRGCLDRYRRLASAIGLAFNAVLGYIAQVYICFRVLVTYH